MYIYSKYITKNGKRIYASQYGLKAFKFWVDDDKKKKK
jgi:hypothetical protein